MKAELNLKDKTLRQYHVPCGEGVASLHKYEGQEYGETDENQNKNKKEMHGGRKTRERRRREEAGSLH